MTKDPNPNTSVALFQEKSVRRVWYQDRWFFSVIDVIAILTDSDRARKYWSDLKTKLVEEGYVEVSEKIGQLKMEAADGKMRVTDAADTCHLSDFLARLCQITWRIWLERRDHEIGLSHKMALHFVSSNQTLSGVFK